MPILNDAAVTFLDIGTRALKVRKALSPNETLGDEDARDVMVSCNAMLKSWSAQRWMVHQIVQEQFDLEEGVRTYSIGVGEDFDTSRPIILMEGCFTRLDNIDSPLTILERDQYDRITDKTTQGVPYAVFYETSFPVANIKLHFVPESDARDIFLNMYLPLERFASLTGDVNLPPEYEECIVYNLAKRLTQFGGRMDPEDLEIAQTSMLTVMGNNVVRYDDTYFAPHVDGRP